METVSLNINLGGCKGWKNVAEDIRSRWLTLDRCKSAGVKHDLNSSSPLPFTDGAVGAYYASHIFEHIKMERMSFVLAELHRTLEQGGLLRVVVPDVEVGIHLYRGRSQSGGLFAVGLPSAPDWYPPTALGRLTAWWYTPDIGTRSGHHQVFDYATLQWWLQTAGFDKIRRRAYGHCSEVFRGMDFVRYKNWCLFVEAMKL